MKHKTGGMGCISVLTLILIVLKLTGNLNWHWIWILCPMWITLSVFIIIFTIIMVAGRLKKGHW